MAQWSPLFDSAILNRLGRTAARIPKHEKPQVALALYFRFYPILYFIFHTAIWASFWTDRSFFQDNELNHEKIS